MIKEQGAAEQLLKVDVLGRVKTPRGRREEILDAFEKSGMPGTQFAQLHGIKYQTFASWVQKRRRAQSGHEVSAIAEAKAEEAFSSLSLAEVVIGNESPSDAGERADGHGGLRVELPGGAVLVLENPAQAGTAAELLRQLQTSH